MKRTLLLAMALILGIAVMASNKPVRMSKSITNKVLNAPVKVADQQLFLTPGNPTVNSKAALEDIIGNTRYDIQTNSSLMNRFIQWPDGTTSAAWMMALTDSYGDRGTGYAYHNGTSWSAVPSTRIETSRTGWPNLNRFMGNGELVISHNSTTSLVFNSRPTKGTGSWTQSTPLTSPAGITSLVWPRAITNGNNFQNIHIITVGQGSLGGQTAALLYYRSLDGGSTFDKMGVVLPELDGTHYLAFGGDDYSWCEPHGDTIAFVVGGGWVDCMLMYSYDNGNTWTKKIIVPNHYSLNPFTVATPAFIATDGAVHGAMDKNGVFHVAFGRMRVSTDGSGTSQYFPGTDGVIYWNSTQPPIDTTILTDLDACITAGICLGYVAANQAGDTIVDFPYYGNALSSYPRVVVDDYNNVYALWSSLTVGNPSPDNYNYRHIWGRALFHGKTTWEEMVDFNSDFLYIFQEYVYPATAFKLKNDMIQFSYQTSGQPGSAVADATIPVHDNNIEFREIHSSEFAAVGVDKKENATRNMVGKNYPNPVTGTTYFNITLEKASNVTVDIINIMGQKVMSIDKGVMQAGTSRIALNADQFKSGIYFYSVMINGEAFTQKMIVE